MEGENDLQVAQENLIVFIKLHLSDFDGGRRKGWIHGLLHQIKCDV